ncbi:hypothetical protein [Variovorax sp. 350MFTsu5.1]|uniref:hypothetical protein n=1 Tax=Variovorax sp. 350MFTsu5.1 TaxID=3158365 RepID=UPI003AB063E8
MANHAGGDARLLRDGLGHLVKHAAKCGLDRRTVRIEGDLAGNAGLQGAVRLFDDLRAGIDCRAVSLLQMLLQL